MLDVFFEDWTKSKELLHLMGTACAFWILVQNPRRSQGISRLFSQRLECTLEGKKKKTQKNICFQNILPSSNSKEGHSAALLGFFTFVWLTSWPGGHGEQGSFHLWVTGWHPSWIRSSSIHADGDSKTPLTWTTRVKAHPAPGHCQARAVPRLLRSPEGYTDQWQNRGPCPEHWLTSWELHASFTNISEMLAYHVWYFMDNCPGVTLEPSK